MPTLASQIAADDAAVDAIRAKFGDAEAAKLAADLYRLRRSPTNSFLTGLPRWALLGAALWVGLLETADKLPFVLLSVPRYQAELAEAKTKMTQLDLVIAQLEKTRYEARAAQWQPYLTAAQGYDAQARFITAASGFSGTLLQTGNVVLYDLRPK